MIARIDAVTHTGRVVSKRHGGTDGAARAARSATAMRAAHAAELPVPIVLSVSDRVLRTAAVTPARDGVTVLGEDPAALLAAIGRFAARLHATPPPRALGDQDHGVWVHGDLCPVNILVEDDRIAAVLDWEDSRIDEPLVDLVWTEWLVRTYHADVVEHLGELYDGYGIPPPAQSRRRGVMRQVLARRGDREHPATTARWAAHLAGVAAMDLSRSIC